MACRQPLHVLTDPIVILIDVQNHTMCVTEHEKYALAATKPGGFAANGVPGGSGGAPTPGAPAVATGLEFLSIRPPWKCRWVLPPGAALEHGSYIYACTFERDSGFSWACTEWDLHVDGYVAVCGPPAPGCSIQGRGALPSTCVCTCNSPRVQWNAAPVAPVRRQRASTTTPSIVLVVHPAVHAWR